MATRPGPSAAALALVEELRREAAEMAAGGTRPAARAALRRFAAELIARGDGAGEAGATKVLLGRTLAAHRPEWDGLLDDQCPEPVAALLAHDLDAALTSGEAFAWPERVLRDALADLLRRAGGDGTGAGWIEVAGDARTADDLSRAMQGWEAAGVRAELVAGASALEATLRDADGWAAYRRSAGRTRSLLLDASEVLATPEWIDGAAHGALVAMFERAVGALLEGGQTGRLERLAEAGVLLRDAARLDPAAGGTRRVRAAAVQAVAGGPIDGATPERLVENARRLIDLALARQSLPAETALLRQARPAYRELLAIARREEANLLAALPDVLRRPDAMTDPGVVATIARARRVVDDLKGLVALSALMTQEPAGAPAGDAVPAPEWDPAAERVLELGQRMARGDDPERMIAHLRKFAQNAARYARMPGEARAREALGPGADPDEREVWTALTGGQAQALLDDIQARWTDWRFAWVRGADDREGAALERLENQRILMQILDDAARVAAVLRGAPDAGDDLPAEYRPLQEWPGWEMPIDTLAAMAGDMAPRLAQATALVLGAEQGAARKDLARARDQYAAVLLCGRLMAGAKERGIGGVAPPASILLEVGTGGPFESGPGTAWLASERAAIADVCRYAEEIESAASLGAADRAVALKTFVNARAAGVLGQRP